MSSLPRALLALAVTDAVVSFAKAHDQIVRGHTLVWHNQLPGWLTGGNWSAAQLTSVLQNHIANVAGHYKGQLYAWDVVNEPFNDDGTYRTSLWYNTLGTGYIATALRAARAADPDAKLYLNDYNTEGGGAKSDAMYNLVRSLKSQGVPIDGVGFQGHLAVQYGFPSGMQANLQRFADLGVDVAIRKPSVYGAISTALGGTGDGGGGGTAACAVGYAVNDWGTPATST